MSEKKCMQKSSSKRGIINKKAEYNNSLKNDDEDNYMKKGTSLNFQRNKKMNKDQFLKEREIAKNGNRSLNG